MEILTLIILELIIINSIYTYTYISIPFKKLSIIPSNLTDVQEILRALEKNQIYTKIEIGSPFQQFEVAINTKNYYTYFVGENATYLNTEILEVPTYKNKNSKTYKFLSEFEMNPFLTNSSYFTDVIRLNDYIIINNKILEGKNYNSYPFDIFNKSGTIGLGIHNYYEDKENNSNFITNLHKNKQINSYNYFIEYSSENAGNIIIGTEPNIYNSNKYPHKLKLFTRTSSMGLTNEWGISIDSMSYNGKNVKMFNKKAHFDFNSGYNIFSSELRDLLNQEIFNELFNKSICFRTSTGIFTENYYCIKSRLDKSKFKSIQFTNLDLKKTFNIDIKKLFVDIGEYSYFLVKFQNSMGVNIMNLGEPFFKENIIIFNQDTKLISIYQNLENNNNSNTRYIIIIILIIIFSCVIIGLSIYLYKMYKMLNKKNRHFDISDDYEYIQQNNPS